MLPIGGHIQHFAPNIVPAAVTTAASNRTNADGPDITVCVDALSHYLDSPLAINGLHGVAGNRADNDLPTLTHLMFYRLQEKTQQSVMIHLIRNHIHLMVDVVELPGNDSMDRLFRAAATAAQAARDWRDETPAASDADTHALRLHIEHTCSMAAPPPYPASSNADGKFEALFQAIQIAFENDHKNQTKQNSDPGPAAARISQRRPHTTSPAVPLLASASASASESASDTGTAPHHGTKRPHRDDTSAINPAAAPASAAIVPRKRLHLDIPGAHPTPP